MKIKLSSFHKIMRKIALIVLILAITLVKAQVQKQITVEPTDKFLNFPINHSGEETMARIKIDGEAFDEFELQPGGEKPDYWTFLEVSHFQGRELTIEVDNEAIAKEFLKLVHADSRFPGQDSLYQEKYRQQIHFSSRRGWNNDPNGMVYYKGEYHLYYQHNPFGWNWGNMHWGHAVSRDMIHWKELPNALFTPEHEHMAFSGSGFIADENTSNFRKDGIDPLVAAYTRTGKGESLALSYDNGRTFQEYEGNPVVTHRGRDPKVFWYKPGQHWVMVVYDESSTFNMDPGKKVYIYQNAIYTSKNLKEWTYQSAVTGFFECPELFEMKVEGESDTKWVMYGADGKYKVGNFDGKKFTSVQPLTRYQYGNEGAFYASQTFNNTPDDRRIQIGWYRVDSPGMPFNQCMTIPMELDLIKRHDKYLLTPQPIKEIKKLHKESHVYKDKLIRGGESFEAPIKAEKLHVIASFIPGDAHDFGLNINGFEMSYDNLRGDLNETHYKVPPDEEFKIEVIVDKLSIEIFVNDGQLYYALPHNSVKSDKNITAFANYDKEQKTILKRLEVHELKSIWGK